MNKEMAETPPQKLEYVEFKRVEVPQKTWFYQKPDGEIFACKEQEATWSGKKFKMIGVGDGKVYADYLKKCGVSIGQVITAKRSKEILDGAFKAELEAARGHLERPRASEILWGDSKAAADAGAIANDLPR